MRRRLPNPRLAKSRMTYNVAEIAELYDCHRNTVRNWLRLGLETIDEHRPALVKGNALNAFHASRRAAGKRPCGPAQLYCAPCRQPREPAGEVAECVEINPKIWKISATCPACGARMTQRVGARRLAEFRERVHLAMTPPQAQIEEAPVSSVNCDFKDKAVTQ